MLDLIAIFRENITPHSVKIILRETSINKKEKQKLNRYIIQNITLSSLLEIGDICEIQYKIYLILKICFLKTLRTKKILSDEILNINMKNFNGEIKPLLHEIFKNGTHKISSFQPNFIEINGKHIESTENDRIYIFICTSTVKIFFSKEIMTLKKNMISDVKIEENSVEIFTEKSKFILGVEDTLKLCNILKSEKENIVFYEDTNEKTGISTKFMSKFSQSSVFNSKDNSFIKKVDLHNSNEEIRTPISILKNDDNIFRRTIPTSNSTKSTSIAEESRCKASIDVFPSSTDLKSTPENSSNMHNSINNATHDSFICEPSPREKNSKIFNLISKQKEIENLSINKLCKELKRRVHKKYAGIKLRIEKYLKN